MQVPPNATAFNVQLGGFGAGQAAFRQFTTLVPSPSVQSITITIPIGGGGNVTPISSLHCNSVNGVQLPIYVTFYNGAGHNLGSANITPTAID
jgi:hypothetical protein